MVTHSSILAWRIPGTEEPGSLQSTGSQRVGYDWATSLFHLFKCPFVYLRSISECCHMAVCVCVCLLSYLLLLATLWTKPARLLCPWDFPARILEWVAISSSRGFPDPGTQPTSIALAGGFFTTEPPKEIPDKAHKLRKERLELREARMVLMGGAEFWKKAGMQRKSSIVLVISVNVDWRPVCGTAGTEGWLWVYTWRFDCQGWGGGSALLTALLFKGHQ